MVQCETIAVTEDQTIRLRTAAKRRCLRSRSKSKKTPKREHHDAAAAAMSVGGRLF